MRKIETRDGNQFARAVGKTTGDLRLTPVEMQKKYGSRLSERFAVNPFDIDRSDALIAMMTAL